MYRYILRCVERFFLNVYCRQDSMETDMSTVLRNIWWFLARNRHMHEWRHDKDKLWVES